MSDMKEVFDALKVHHKERRQRNYDAFKAIEPQLLGLGLIKQNDYHYTFTLDKMKGQYWPSSSRWQLKNKSFNGTPEAFIGWLKKRQGSPNG